jgi:hypothetical protein
MAVTITHVVLWGSSATNHIENALMGSPCVEVVEVLQNVKTKQGVIMTPLKIIQIAQINKYY